MSSYLMSYSAIVNLTLAEIDHISNIRILKPTFVGVKKKVSFIIKTFWEL